MPLDQFHKLVFALARHSNMTGMGERDGYVHEVKGDKMRVVMGIKPDGSPWLSPWTPTSDHRGGSRERNMYVKGQNVRISAPGSDYRQATISPGPHGKSFPAPAHADQVNGDTYQAGKLRISSARTGGDKGGGGQGQQGQGGQQDQQGQDDDHYHDIWIAEEDDNPPQHQDQSGQEGNSGSGGQQGQQQQSQQQQSSGGEAKMKLRVSEKGYITARVGKGNDAMRFSVHKDGVKLSSGNNSKAIFVDKDGCWTTHDIQKKGCSIPDDDK